LTSYGQISAANVKAHVQTYIDQPTRDAQNSFMMYECLTKSLTGPALNEVITETATFTVNNIQSGPLFLFAIIKKAAINTRSTTTHVRTNLSSLDKYILTIDCDIHLLHQYVKGLKQDLVARGEMSNDILFNLFKGYAVVADVDVDFKEYIKAKKSAYEDGTIDLNEETLMDLAQNKFDALVQEGTLNRPSVEQAQIIALTSTIENMSRASAVAPRVARLKPTKEKVAFASPCANEGEFAWKSVAPTVKSKTKVVNNKTYHWCFSTRPGLFIPPESAVLQVRKQPLLPLLLERAREATLPSLRHSSA
jgi:hypothetical protein